MKINNLQYQLSNGMWADCSDRTDYFLNQCVKYGSVKDENEAITKLDDGLKIRNHHSDWYSYCRVKPKQKTIIERKFKCDCGHYVLIENMMNANIGTSCADCYDKMC